MMPARREAWGPVASIRSPLSDSANSSWRWQWESNHSTTASSTGPGQPLRRGKRGAPFSTGRPPG